MAVEAAAACEQAASVAAVGSVVVACVQLASTGAVRWRVTESGMPDSAGPTSACLAGLATDLVGAEAGAEAGAEITGGDLVGVGVRRPWERA